jgi:hypothetical protein
VTCVAPARRGTLEGIPPGEVRSGKMRERLRVGLFTGLGIAIVIVIVAAAAITLAVVGRAYRNTCSSYCVPAPAVTWKTAS